MDNQSQVVTSSAGAGSAGDINLKATNNLLINDESIITSASEFGAVGNGGNINLQTLTLTLSNQSEITSRSQGAQSNNAGSIGINAEQVSLDNNSQVSASTSAGEGGTISLTANTLEVTNGGQIRTTTNGVNRAGNINLKIEEYLSLSGDNSGLFADTDVNSLGNGGNIFIDPPIFIIEDGATVAVNSQGTGQGGNINIFAGDLLLNNGIISAQTDNNTGGNITLQIVNTLRLLDGSQISTTAGTGKAGGDGGNINITANLILADLRENSDITANAFTGQGGNIVITARNILGLILPKQLSPF